MKSTCNDGLVIPRSNPLIAGQIEGRSVSRARSWHTYVSSRKRINYPTALRIADSKANELSYSVFSIPMSFLIDRRGTVRL